MTRVRLLLLAIGLTVWGLPGGPLLAQDESPDAVDEVRLGWQTYRDAQTRARTEGKPLLLYFTAPWSPYGAKMQRETFTDRRVVRALNADFALARIDTDELPALARKFSVEGLPTMWFLDPDGKRLTHTDGFVSAENLLPLLEFIVARDYEWTDYTTWLERRK